MSDIFHTVVSLKYSYNSSLASVAPDWRNQGTTSATPMKDTASDSNIKYLAEIKSLKAARMNEQEQSPAKEQETQGLRDEITMHLAGISKFKKHSNKISRSVDDESAPDTEGPKKSHQREAEPSDTPPTTYNAALHKGTRP